MKKALFALLTVLLVTANATAFISPCDLIVRTDVTSGTFVVRTTTPVTATTTVAILTTNDQPVYKGELSAGHFLNKRFPLASLPFGTYRLVLTDSLGQLVQPLVVNKQGVRQNLAKASHQLFPKVKLRDDRLLVVRYGNEQGRRVNISVADEAGETVFSDRVEGADIQRAYQLDNLAAGAYYVTVSGRNVQRYTTAIALD